MCVRKNFTRGAIICQQSPRTTPVPPVAGQTYIDAPQAINDRPKGVWSNYNNLIFFPFSDFFSFFQQTFSQNDLNGLPLSPSFSI